MGRGGEGDEAGELPNTRRGAVNGASWRVQHAVVASWVLATYFACALIVVRHRVGCFQ